MIVFKNPRGDGYILFLDCEGGQNHNQTALPFVIGLAARLAARMYVFERGCFTTGVSFNLLYRECKYLDLLTNFKLKERILTNQGLDTVMQVINMGHATSTTELITKTIVCVENMTINSEIPNEDLLTDLLNEEDGDENTNRVRGLIKARFAMEFVKLPFDVGGENQILHAESKFSFDTPAPL